MGFNLVIRCTTHKVAVHCLRHYEQLGIEFMATQHGSAQCNRELQLDNGFGPGTEWDPETEGYKLHVLPRPKAEVESDNPDALQEVVNE